MFEALGKAGYSADRVFPPNTIVSNQISDVFLEQTLRLVVSQNMNTLLFKVVAVSVFVIEGLAVLVLLGPRFQHVTPPLHSIVKITLFFTIGTSVAVGLLFSRRWAAVIVSIFSIYLAIGTYRLSYSSPVGLRIVGVSLAILFLVPAVGSILRWNLLKPGGKYYL